MASESPHSSSAMVASTPAVALFGSYDFPNLALVHAFVRALPEGTTCILPMSPYRPTKWPPVYRAMDVALRSREGTLTVGYCPVDWSIGGVEAFIVRDHEWATRILTLAQGPLARAVCFWDGREDTSRTTLRRLVAEGLHYALIMDGTPVADVVGCAWALAPNGPAFPAALTPDLQTT